MKVGEGSPVPQQPTATNYSQELAANSATFLGALKGYQGTQDAGQRAHFLAVMNEQIPLIRAAVAELSTKGIQNQEIKVENDYRAFIGNDTPANISALQQDMETLKEYTKVTTPPTPKTL